MEGLDGLTVEQAYELTDASAERSAAGGVIALDADKVASFLRSNIALMRRMIEEGYRDAGTLEGRIRACEAWLKDPVLLKRDAQAEYAAVLEIDLDGITEPILACPNDPDDVKPLSEVAGERIDEVFIGSCMTNIGHFRAAGRIFDKAGPLGPRVWMTPPTKMDAAPAQEGRALCRLFPGGGPDGDPRAARSAWGTRPGSGRGRRSSRRRPGTSTTGWGTGPGFISGRPSWPPSPPSRAVCPPPTSTSTVMKEKVLPHAADIYRYLEFDKMKDFTLGYP